MADNLEKQGGVYHVRMAIPKDAQSAFGNRRVLSKSLGTSSRNEALTLRLPYLTEWKARIQSVRAARLLPEDWKETISSHVIAVQEIKQHHKLKAIGENLPPLAYKPDQALVDSMLQDKRFTDLLKPLIIQRKRNGLVGEIEFEDALAASVLNAFKGFYQSKYKLTQSQSADLSELIADPKSYKPKSPITHARIEAFKQFGIRQGLAPKSLDIQTSKLAKLSQYLCCEGRPLDFDTITAWLDSLSYAPKTLRQYIWAGSQYWKWASKYDARWREDFKGKPNPFEGHVVRQPKARESAGARRKAFSIAHLIKLYTASQEKGLTNLSSLIILAGYTGARIEELCKLRTEDVTSIEGVVVLSITDSKTEAGIRAVPVHPNLSPLVQRLKQQSEDGYLIPSTGGNKYGIRSDLYSKAFGRLKTQLGYGRDYVFHSIRKTFITELHRADVAGVTLAAIVGHETGTVTFDVYSAGPSIQQKYTAICKLALGLSEVGK